MLYGRDSSRFDQIYGDDFAYNQKTGDVTAKGDVQIDLVANPAGLASPDQSTPKELKNPIHLKTRDLVFNKETRKRRDRCARRISHAAGHRMGRGREVRGQEQHVDSCRRRFMWCSTARTRPSSRPSTASSPTIRARLCSNILISAAKAERCRPITAVFYLGHDNQVERVLATGNVTTVTRTQGARHHKASAANRLLPATDARRVRNAQPRRSGGVSAPGKEDLLRTATMTGNVHIEQTGPQPMQGDAGRVIMDFAGQNQLQKVHALDGVRLTQNTIAGSKPAAKSMTSGPQDFELTAPVIDFTRGARTHSATRRNLRRRADHDRASRRKRPRVRTSALLPNRRW